MNNRTDYWLPGAFFLGFFGVGIPYWLIPYNRLNLPDALLEPGLILVAGTALILRACSVSTFWRIVTIMGAAVPAVVLARVVWDGFKDATSHNLWPVEFVIALITGFSCAFAGAGVGSVVGTLSTEKPESGKR